MPSTKNIDARFKTTNWTDNPVVNATGLVHAVLEGKYVNSEIQGDAATGYIMAPFGPTADDDGKRLLNCRFDGQQIFHGSVDGKTGSFAARDYGYIRDGHLEGTWEIIPETGTGELQGIIGRCEYGIALQDKGTEHLMPMTMEIVLP